MAKKTKKEIKQIRKKIACFIGRQMEVTVELLIKDMTRAKLIQGGKMYQPCSPKDHQGKDFVVISKTGFVFEFGITTSEERFRHHRKRHPKVHQFKFHMGCQKEKMLDAIMTELRRRETFYREARARNPTNPNHPEGKLDENLH